MTARQPKGQPTGGQFAATGRSAADIALTPAGLKSHAVIDALDNGLRGTVSELTRAGETLSVRDLIDDPAGPDHITLTVEKDGTLTAHAAFTSVDMTWFAANVLNRDPDAAGESTLDVEEDEDQLVDFLNSHAEKITDYFTQQGITQVGYEWDDETLEVGVRGIPADTSWTELGQTLNASDAYTRVRDGLVTHGSTMPSELAAALTGDSVETWRQRFAA